MSDVNHPKHYNSGKIEVIEAIEDWGLGFHLGNVVKYVARAGKKDASKEVEDLEKARWYLSRRIELLKAVRENRAPVRPNGMNPPDSVKVVAKIQVDTEALLAKASAGVTNPPTGAWAKTSKFSIQEEIEQLIAELHIGERFKMPGKKKAFRYKFSPHDELDSTGVLIERIK